MLKAIHMNGLKEVFKDERRGLALFSIVLLDFLLRLYHLGNQSLWHDELFTAFRIQLSFTELFQNLKGTPHVPLYYYLLKLWCDLFGHSEFVLRFPSLIFSVLTIIFTYKLASKLYDQKTAWVAALLVSLSPYSIYYAQEAKMYALLWFLMTGSFYFLYQFMKEDKLSHLLGYILTTTLSLYTLSVGFMLLVICNVSALFLCPTKKQAGKWILAHLLIFLFYLPWMSTFLSSARNRTGLDWISSQNYLTIVLTLLARVWGCLEKNPTNLWQVLFFSGILLTAFIAIHKTHHRKFSISIGKNDVLLMVWIFTPIVVYGILHLLEYPLLSIGSTRYAGSIHIPLMILMSRGISRYPIQWKVPVLTLIAFIFAFHLYSYYGKDYKILYPQDWRGLFKEINQRAETDSLILTDRPQINYYNTRGLRIEPLTYYHQFEKDHSKEEVDSFFFILIRFSKADLHFKPKPIQGYKLRERYSKGEIGYFWFKKI